MRPRRRRPSPNDRVVPRTRPERINEEIRAQRVRLVDEEGGQVGILTTREALEFANTKGLDLVEVAAGADPPVARVMDYSKYR
ncbi:MAG: translation initiation factor IF-3, partial [Actinobacteria bacterium]|nr:translation initiation factor IF-3 [Actinomycetota bacterium]